MAALRKQNTQRNTKSLGGRSPRVRNTRRQQTIPRRAYHKQQRRLRNRGGSIVTAWLYPQPIEIELDTSKSLREKGEQIVAAIRQHEDYEIQGGTIVALQNLDLYQGLCERGASIDDWCASFHLGVNPNFPTYVELDLSKTFKEQEESIMKQLKSSGSIESIERSELGGYQNVLGEKVRIDPATTKPRNVKFARNDHYYVNRLSSEPAAAMRATV